MAAGVAGIPGELFVKLRPDALAKVRSRIPPKGAGSRETRVGLESVDAALAPFGVRRISLVIETFLLVEMDPGADLTRARDALLRDPHVEAVEVHQRAVTS